MHDYGFDCPCAQTPNERRRRLDEWTAARDEFWASEEGRRITAMRAAEDAELAVWLSEVPGVVVREHGGFAPEQWWGEVEGRPFYFRERHDQWRIELDLRPCGRFSTVWTGGDLDDDTSFDQVELERGDVIAEGTTGVEGYGTTPAQRARFIVRVIRTHLRRQSCDVHTLGRVDLERRLGGSAARCPECGAELSAGD